MSLSQCVEGPAGRVCGFQAGIAQGEMSNCCGVGGGERQIFRNGASGCTGLEHEVGRFSGTRDFAAVVVGRPNGLDLIDRDETGLSGEGSTQDTFVGR